MGYDMHVVDVDGNSVRCENDYWRRNIMGGGRQADIFVELGLGSWPDPEIYRKIEEHGFPHPPDGVEYVYDDDTDEEGYQGDGATEYTAALHAHLRDRRGAGPGISVYKLCNTNDGWWVTRAECREFLELWEAAGRPAVDDFGSGPYEDTIPFIRAAVEHHGFRVY